MELAEAAVPDEVEDHGRPGRTPPPPRPGIKSGCGPDASTRKMCSRELEASDVSPEPAQVGDALRLEASLLPKLLRHALSGSSPGSTNPRR